MLLSGTCACHRWIHSLTVGICGNSRPTIYEATRYDFRIADCLLLVLARISLERDFCFLSAFVENKLSRGLYQ